MLPRCWPYSITAAMSPWPMRYWLLAGDCVAWDQSHSWYLKHLQRTDLITVVIVRRLYAMP